MEGIESRVPGVVEDFFGDEQGKTLLIKGPPGSGKTIFALSLLNKVKSPGVYLSTRVDPETLYQQSPWIKEEIPEDNVVDATQSERPVSRGIKPLKYTDVPDFLKAVYMRTESLENPFVIIDSWDAVVSHTGYYEPRDREKLENNLCDFARKTSTKIVFIVEYLEQKPLDYFADGVVTMESETYEERRIRRMSLQKIRGQPISQPTHLFTLAGGVFKSLLPTRVETDVTVTESMPDTGEYISTGIRDLDLIIGGYGHLNIFEGDYALYDLLMRAMAINQLNQGRKVVLSSERLDLDLDGVERVDEVSDIGAERPIVILDFEDVKKMRKGYFFTYTEETNKKEVVSLASTYIKLRMISGVPCVYGEIPRTEIYAIELPELKLTPIV